MSYQVIARKWRPQSFAGLVGQAHITHTLINAIKHQRLPHALLFTGLRGTGKTSAARILAMTLRCPNVKDFIPCGECPDCIDISHGKSVDVIEIDGASNNGVDDVRELRSSVGYMPSSGVYKIYIIDEVHMLSTSAFNALLKTLEEPPSNVIFILATTEAHKVPSTILSRCQRFDFRRIPTRQIFEHLNHICKTEKVVTEEEALWIIARQAEGSMRDAQSLLDQIITFCEGKITVPQCVDILGLTPRSLLITTLEGLISRKVTSLIQVIEDLLSSGVNPKVFLKSFLEELRNLLMIKSFPKDLGKMVDLSDSEIQKLQNLGASLSSEDIHLLFDMAFKGSLEISQAQSPRIHLEMLLLRMAAAPRIQDLGTLIQQGASLREGPPVKSTGRTSGSLPSSAPPQPTTRPNLDNNNHPIPEKKPTADPLQTSSNTTMDSPADPNETVISHSSKTSHNWAELVGRIKRVNGLIAAKLEHTYLVHMDKESIRIGIPSKLTFLYDQLTEENFKKKLSNYMKTFWGTSLRLEVVLGNENESVSSEVKPMTPKFIEEKKGKDKDAKILRDVEDHPLVKTTKKVFNTKIKAIKEMT